MKTATTVTEFNAVWATLAPGDDVYVLGVTFPGEFTLKNKKITGTPASINFIDCSFPGVGVAQNVPSVWLDNLSGINFYGGNITGPKSGKGILVYDCDHIKWHDFVCHDTGADGLAVFSITRPCDTLDFRGECSNWGLNLAFDPHATKGTGLHGANIDDSNYGVKNSTFVLHVHDSHCGSGVEVGGSKTTDGVSNCSFVVCAHNLALPTAIGQTAANAVQVWGYNVLNNKFVIKDWAIAGVPFHTAMYSGQSLSTDVVTIL